MIKLIMIPGLIVLSCGSIKSNQAGANTDSVVVVTPATPATPDVAKEQEEAWAGLPTCIKNKIDSFKLKETHERPQRVEEYLYNGKKVYYVVMPCCDFFNEVYDQNCKYLGAPEGGFSGKGDGKLPDFFEKATSKKLIWGSAK